jgi:hypothetical protein
MKNNKSELESLLDKLETINWWQRLFSWSKVTYLIGKSRIELDNLETNLNKEINIKEEILRNSEKLNLEIKHANDNYNKINLRNIQLEQENKDLIQTNKQYSNELERYKTNFESKAEELNNIIDWHKEEIQKLKDEEKKKIEQKYLDIENTWKEHETNVEQIITNICKRNTIDYFNKEKVPFDKKPDNTIKIANEYIIFDSKSPGDIDKLNNFPKYIKDQAEKLKKYIDQDNVKKTAYLVVPFDTIKILQDKLKELILQIGNYKVFIITPDSLESIIVSLKKIEDYDFAEKLSPQDRDIICDLIGKFAHSSKRRIEIDNYLNEDALNILVNCEALPESIKDKSKDFEKSAKINPPMDKLNKMLKLEDLNKKIKIIKTKKKLLE